MKKSIVVFIIVTIIFLTGCLATSDTETTADIITEPEPETASKWITLLECKDLAEYSAMIEEYMSISTLSEIYDSPAYVLPGETFAFAISKTREAYLMEIGTLETLLLLKNVDFPLEGQCEIYKTTQEGSICFRPSASSSSIPEWGEAEEFYAQFFSLGKGGEECWLASVIQRFFSPEDIVVIGGYIFPVPPEPVLATPLPSPG